MTKGDLNGDGLDDIFIGGANGTSGAIFLQQKNNQFKLRQTNAFEADKKSEDSKALVFDANGDGFLDIYVASGGYHNYAIGDPALQDRLYLNDGKANFTKSISSLPKNTESNSALAVHDFNGDGHLDIFVGARLVPGRYPETPSSALLINDGKGQFIDQIKTIAPGLKNYGMITDAEWIDLNNDGQKDLVVVGEWLPVSAFIFNNEN